MSVHSLWFLAFLCAALLLYYLFPKKHRWLVLLAASLVFYLSFGAEKALWLLLTTLLTYGAGLYLDLCNRRAAEEEDRAAAARLLRRKKAALALALAVNFFTLLLLKYASFFINNVNNLFRLQLPLPSLLLPLGISFYIFQTAAYLIDLYRAKYPAQRNPLKYLLFVSWFPQIVQGPINRYPQLSGPLFEGSDFSWDRLPRGVLRMLYGILKKVLVADALAPIVEQIYQNYPSYPGLISFLGALLYCVQLYCDFSGGVDLLRGVSGLFGVEMAENFRQPYFARSLGDFWRRWHISLGEWMKDYLFYPLALSGGMSRLTRFARKHLPADFAKRLAPCAATFLVFLAVGIWQGPGWANIAYGIWNGFWMSLGLLWIPISSRLRLKPPTQKKVPALIWGVLRTNLLVIIGRYFSHAPNLRTALGMLKQTFFAPGFHALTAGTFSALGFTPALLLQLALSIAVIFTVSLAQERGRDVAEAFCAKKWYVQLAVLFLLLFIVIMTVYANSDYVPIAYVYEKV